MRGHADFVLISMPLYVLGAFPNGLLDVNQCAVDGLYKQDNMKHVTYIV